MDFLGPIGLTLAAAYVLQRLVLDHVRLSSRPQAGATTSTRSIGQLIDYRFVLLGAFAPDALDKALAFWIAPELVNHSLRNFGHTLVGAALVLGVVAMMTRRNEAFAGTLLAIAAHYVMDRMWQLPEILFWPAMGGSFPPGDVPLSHWLNVHFLSLPTAPIDWLGLGLLAAIMIKTVVSGRSIQFLRTGRIA